MADAAKLSGVKCLLRSVLQSVKEGVLPRNINRDYREFAGEGIPYKALGHGSLDDFIRSIPDVVKVSRNKDGEVVYRAVADANTAHIAKLVSNQASRKKKGGRGGMRRPAFHTKAGLSPRLHYTPRMVRPPSSHLSNWPNNHSKLLRQVPPVNQRSRSRGKAGWPATDGSLKGFHPSTTPQRSSRRPPALPVAPNRRNIQESPGGSVKVTVVRTPSPRKPAKVQPKIQTKSRGRKISPAEIPRIRQRVKELVDRRENGLWDSRLLLEYKEEYKDEPPENFIELLQEWPDIVIVERAVGDNQWILYSVPPPSPTPSPPRPARHLTSTPSPVRSLSISPIRCSQSPQSPPPVSRVEPAPSIPNAALPAVGTKPLVLISYVVDCTHFFIHLVDSAIGDITQRLTDLYWNDEVRLVENPVSGDYCTAECEEDIWCRAQLLSVVEKDDDKECAINYLDFGNTEIVKRSKIRFLESEMFAWPIQAIRCRLDRVFPTKNSAQWEEATETLMGYDGSQIQMHVIAHEEETCVVELYPEQGKAKSINVSLRESNLALSYKMVSDTVPLEMPEEDEWDVVLSGIITANQVFLRLVGDKYSEMLSDLEELIAKNSVEVKDFVPEVDDLCAAYDKSATNEGDVPWYRVRVTSVTEDGVLCEFVDYGGNVTLPRDKVRPLLPEEAKLPFQAMPAYLTGLERCEENRKVHGQLEPWLGKTIIASVDSREGVPTVTLWDTSTEDDVNINQVIAEVIDLIDLEPGLPEVGSMCEGYLCHIEVDCTVYLQMMGPGLLELEALTEEAVKVYAKSGAEKFVKDTMVGRLVMTLYSDGGWYRACIKENLPGRKVMVFMVDYGNTEMVACSSLRELESANKKLFSLPYQAVPVKLDLLNDKTWTPKVFEQLGDLAPEASIHIKTVVSPTEDTAAIVHLYQPILNGSADFISINKQLLNPALWEETKEDKEIAQPEANPEEGEAELTTEATTQLLAETEDLLHELSMTSTYSDLSGSHGDEEVAATNVSTETGMPERLDMGVWQLEQCAGFTPISPGGAGDVAVKAENDSHLSCDSDRNIPKDLNSNTLPGTLGLSSPTEGGDGETTWRNADSHQLPPRAPSPKSGCSMHIVWVGDPSTFTCVRSEELDNLDDMMNQLTLFYEDRCDDMVLETVMAGELYGGYHEDRWYRIIVKDIFDQPLLNTSTMVSVQLVDHGHFTFLPKECVRRLPAQFRTYPFQGIMAKLAGIEPLDGGWSADVISRFESLVLHKTMTAWILGGDENGRVGMTLLDIEGEPTLIHRKLLQEGLALCTSLDNSQSE